MNLASEREVPTSQLVEMREVTESGGTHAEGSAVVGEDSTSSGGKSLEAQFEAMRGAGRPKGYYAADGERIPSMTTILGRFKDSGGLVVWANREGLAGRTLDEARKDATDVGTLVHRLVEAEIHAEIKPRIPDEYRDRALSSFGAWKTWMAQTRLEIVATEVSLVSEAHRFGGTIDAVVKDSEGRIGLADWKSSNAFYVDYLLQIAGYGLLWDECAPEHLRITRGFDLLRFDKESGDFAHKHFDSLDDAAAMFLLLREAYEIDKALKRRVK